MAQAVQMQGGNRMISLQLGEELVQVIYAAVNDVPTKLGRPILNEIDRQVAAQFGPPPGEKKRRGRPKAAARAPASKRATRIRPGNLNGGASV